MKRNIAFLMAGFLGFAGVGTLKQVKADEISSTAYDYIILEDNDEVRVAQSKDENYIVTATFNKQTELTDIKVVNKLTRSVEVELNDLTIEDLERDWIDCSISILSGAGGGMLAGGAAGSVVPGWGTGFGAVSGAVFGAGAGYIVGCTI